VFDDASTVPTSQWAIKARRDRERFVARRIDELCVAVASRAPALFVEDIAWAKVALAARGIDVDLFLKCLLALHRIVADGFANTESERVLNAAVRAYDNLPVQLPIAVPPSNAYAGLVRAYLAELFARDMGRASRLILDAAHRGVPVTALYHDVLGVAQRELGRLWQSNHIKASDEAFGTAVSRHVMGLLRGDPPPRAREGRTLLALAAAGDPHELGPQMVADVFERAGWNAFFLGPHPSTGWVLDAIVRRRADVVAISTALTRHVPTVTMFVAAIRKRRETAGVVVMVGGRPFNLVPDLWSTVGADGTAPSAQAAVDAAEALVARRCSDDAAPRP